MIIIDKDLSFTFIITSISCKQHNITIQQIKKPYLVHGCFRMISSNFNLKTSKLITQVKKIQSLAAWFMATGKLYQFEPANLGNEIKFLLNKLFLGKMLYLLFMKPN